MCRVPVNQKKFNYLAGYGVKSMRPIFETKTLIYQSKADLDENFFLVKSFIILTQKLGKCL